MARLPGPDDGSRLVYRVVGRAVASAAGADAVFYSDAAATALADLRVHDGTGTPGAVVAGSTLTVDGYSQVPLFWFPDGVDTVWAVVDGGPATAVYARTDDRLDALVTGAAAEVATRAAADALLVPLATVGAASGVAPLDGDAKVPSANLPPITITDTFVVASQAAMLALTAQRGDVAIRTDVPKTFILSTDSPATLADWVELPTPTDLVSSVAGRTGAVVLAEADVTGLVADLATKVAKGDMVINVKDYGATGDGVTDDRAAIEAATAAAVAAIAASGKGAVVYLPPGVNYLSSVCASPPTNPSTGLPYSTQIGIGLPVNLAARLTIRGAGRGVTTIKLSDNARNAFWINQAADYDTFRNVTLEDFDVDNNNAVGRCHVVIGSMPAANTSQRRLNYADLDVRRINVRNVPNDLSGVTSYKSHVFFLGSHPAALEATQTSTRRVTVEDMLMYDGSNGVIVCSFGAGSLVGGTNHYYDQVFFRRCRHEITVAPTATAGQTGFYLCGTGFGDYFEIEDCHSVNIADDGFEIGAMQRGVVRDCSSTDAFLVGLLFRHTHVPTRIARQKIEVQRFRSAFTSTLAAVTGAICRPVSWLADDACTFGDYALTDYTHTMDAVDYTKQGTSSPAFLFNSGVVARIKFDKLKLVCQSYTCAVTSGTNNIALVDNQNTAGEIIIRDLDIVGSGTFSGGASATDNFIGVHHRGGANRMHVDGYTVDMSGSAWTNSTGGGMYFYSIHQAGSVGAVRGSLRRFGPLGPNGGIGAGLRDIQIGSSSTITSYVIADSDLSAITSLTKDVDNTTSNAAKVYIHNVIGSDGVRLGPNGRRATAANLTARADDAYIGVTSTAAARTITLPAANARPAGFPLVVKDESGAAGTNNITLARAGSDTIDGATSLVISTNFGVAKVYSDGSTKWFVV